MANMRSLSKRLAVGALIGGTLFMGNVQPAAAWPGWREVNLGTSSDYWGYYRSKGQIAVATAPWDRNDYCRWKHGRGDAKGRGVGPFFSQQSTQCYYTYWQWW